MVQENQIIVRDSSGKVEQATDKSLVGKTISDSEARSLTEPKPEQGRIIRSKTTQSNETTPYEQTGKGEGMIITSEKGSNIYDISGGYNNQKLIASTQPIKTSGKVENIGIGNGSVTIITSTEVPAYQETVFVNGQGYSVAKELQPTFKPSLPQSTTQTVQTSQSFNTVRPTSEVFGTPTPLQIIGRYEEQFGSKSQSSTNLGFVYGAGAFALGVGKTVGTAVTNPLSIVTGTYQLGKDIITDPFKVGYDVGEQLYTNPAGFTGEQYGGYLIGKGISSSSKVINANEFTSKQIIFGNAETFGKKVVTPAEREIFTPKLEKVNVVQTDFGVIEIEITKPELFNKEIKVEPKPTNLKSSIESPTVSEQKTYSSQSTNLGTDFSSYDFGGKTKSLAGNRLEGFGGGSQSLQQQSQVSLETNYPTQVIIELEQAQGTLPQSKLKFDYVPQVSLRTQTTPSTTTISKPIQSNALNTSTSNIQSFETVFRSQTIPTLKNNIDTINKQSSQTKNIQTQNFIQEYKVKQEQQLNQVQQLKRVQEQKQELKQDYELPEFNFNTNAKDNKKFNKKVQLFVRKKGKFESRGLFENVGQAFKSGIKETSTTARASFKLAEEGSNKAINPNQPLPQAFKFGKKDQFVVVQQAPYRISDIGEKSELRQARSSKRLI